MDVRGILWANLRATMILDDGAKSMKDRRILSKIKTHCLQSWHIPSLAFISHSIWRCYEKVRDFRELWNVSADFLGKVTDSSSGKTMPRVIRTNVHLGGRTFRWELRGLRRSCNRRKMYYSINRQVETGELQTRMKSFHDFDEYIH